MIAAVHRAALRPRGGGYRLRGQAIIWHVGMARQT